LDENNPAFSSFIIKPHLLNGLNHAEGKTDTIRGTVASKWKTEKGKITLEVEIPFNTSATVFIPGKENEELFESNVHAKEAEGVEYLDFTDGMHRLRVFSGKYKFSSELI
jgi:alpha-L-rhamnosidase